MEIDSASPTTTNSNDAMQYKTEIAHILKTSAH